MSHCLQMGDDHPYVPLNICASSFLLYASMPIHTERDIVIASVCPSVCLPHARIVSKQRTSSNNQIMSRGLPATAEFIVKPVVMIILQGHPRMLMRELFAIVNLLLGCTGRSCARLYSYLCFSCFCCVVIAFSGVHSTMGVSRSSSEPSLGHTMVSQLSYACNDYEFVRCFQHLVHFVCITHLRRRRRHQLRHRHRQQQQYSIIIY